MKYTDLKKLKTFCESLYSEPDWRDVVEEMENDNIDFQVNGERFTAVYQTGVDFLLNDIDCPSPLLELSEEGGCNRVLVLIGTMYEKDFEDSAILSDILSEVKELTPAIKTVKDIYTVWDFLRNNKPDTFDFIKDK